MRKNFLYGVAVALAGLMVAAPSLLSAGEPKCSVSGFWFFEQTTCRYESEDGSLVSVIKYDSDGDVTSIRHY